MIYGADVRSCGAGHRCQREKQNRGQMCQDNKEYLTFRTKLIWTFYQIKKNIVVVYFNKSLPRNVLRC